MPETESIYDILNIPYFPYSPTQFAWIIFAIFFAVLGILVLFLSRKKVKYSTNLLDSCINELSQLSTQKLTKLTAARITLLIKRLLQTIEGKEFTSMSTIELQSTLENTENIHVKHLINEVCALDVYKYDREDVELPKETVLRILEIIKSYRNER